MAAHPNRGGMAFDSSYAGQVAVVTGGASGLGRGLCEALASRGAKVVIADINLAGAEALADELTRAGCEVCACHVDVTSSVSVDGLIARAVETYGRLDLMFNNAGIAVGGEFQDVSADALARVVNINLIGAAYGTLAAYRQMLAQKGGCIVNIASMYALFPGPMTSAYVAAKHGLLGLTLSVQSEARAHGIHLCLVCPGYVTTNLFAHGTYGGGLDAASAVERVPFSFLDVRTAVDHTLAAVRKRKHIAVFPFYARAIWWIARISPALLVLIMSLVMRMQRKRYGTSA
jgi:NAD(P)-dependent dehydrogenase (short-subunit alcohol dehydrogenase family)